MAQGTRHKVHDTRYKVEDGLEGTSLHITTYVERGGSFLDGVGVVFI